MKHFRGFSFLAAWVLSLAFLPAAEAGVQQSWKIFKGHYFQIAVPPGFSPTPQGEVNNGASDELSLWNPDSQVEFTVYAPLWNGEALFKEVKARHEELTERTRKKTGDVVEEHLTITAKDKSYTRFVVSWTNKVTNNTTAFGIRVPNMTVYNQVKPTYVAWKKTLVQFAD